MKYQTILFDLDGTLTDSKEGIFKSLRHTFDTLGESCPDEALLKQFIGPPLHESFIQFCGYSREKAFHAIDIFRERYETLGKFENYPAPGLPELCQRLKTEGYALALSSSKPEVMCVQICEKFGYAESLDVICGSPGEGDHTKADIIRETFRRLGLNDADKPSVLMVGDRKFDVLGAKEVGIDCVGVEFFGYADQGELKNAGAVTVVQTVDQLSTFIHQ